MPPLPDGCFALVPIEESAERLVQPMRSFRPHVVTTYDEKGGYPLPTCPLPRRERGSVHAAGDAAHPDAGDRGSADGLLPAPWIRPKMMAIPRGDAAPRPGVSLCRAPRGVEARSRRSRVTTRVPCGDYFGVRDQALMAHASQSTPTGRGSAARERSASSVADRGLRSWSAATWSRRCQRTTCSPASTRGPDPALRLRMTSCSWCSVALPGVLPLLDGAAPSEQHAGGRGRQGGLDRVGCCFVLRHPGRGVPGVQPHRASCARRRRPATRASTATLRGPPTKTRRAPTGADETLGRWP